MSGKLRTNKAIAKRFKVTKNNKFMHQKAGVSHLLTNKNKAQRQMTSGKILSERESKKIMALIPYKLR